MYVTGIHIVFPIFSLKKKQVNTLILENLCIDSLFLETDQLQIPMFNFKKALYDCKQTSDKRIINLEINLLPA